MALAVSLEASFSSDGGFDFDATMSGLGEDILDFDPGEITFDAADILDVLAAVAPPELSGVLEAAQTVAAQAELNLGDLEVGEDLLAPIHDLLGRLGLAETLDFGTGIDAPLGLDGLSSRLSTGLALVTDGQLSPLAELAEGALPDLDLLNVLGDLGGTTGGLIALVRLIAGLMAIETVTAKVERHAGLLGGALNRPLAKSLGDKVLAETDRRELAGAISALDQTNSLEAERVVVAVRRFVLAVREMSHEWSSGMGLGEAALVGLDPAGCSTLMTAGRLALDESQLPIVGDFAATVRGWVEPIMSTPLPDPQDGLEETVDAALNLIADIQAAAEGLQVENAVAQITSSLTGVLSPIQEIVGTIEAVSTSVGSAIRQVGDVVNEIDLGPLVSGVEAALRPITDALDAIDDLILEATETIETVANAIIDGLGDATDSIEDVAELVQDALGGLSSRLAAIDFAALQAQVEAGIGSVADTLASAQLSPYFDASIEVIDTTADVVDAVPFGILPSDVQQEIVDAVRPVKEIQFGTIADDLQLRLAGIIEALNSDVLDEIDSAYQDVLAFLASIDPGAAIADFEAGPFTELRAQVDDVDPEALLAPVQEQIDSVRSVLGGIDLRAEVLGPVNGVFDTIRTELDNLDPAELLAPVQTEVDDLRNQITETVHLDVWADTVNTARDQLVAGIEQLDVEAFSDAFMSGTADRLRSTPHAMSVGIATAISSLAQATGLAADPDAFDQVMTWFGPTDGRRSVEARMTGSANVVTGTLDAVRALDPAPIVTAAQAHHRSLIQATNGLPDGHPAKSELRSLLVGNEPSVVLGPLLGNRTRYLARLEIDAGLTTALSQTGLSEIQVVTDGLRDQLTPLTSILEWVKSLLGRFGMADLDRPFAEIFLELLETAGPDRLLPPLVGLVEYLQGLLIELIDAITDPILSVVADVEAIIGVLDLGPILTELGAVQAEVVEMVDAVDPAVLLGPALSEADAVVDRLESFDPLDPVRAVIEALQASIENLFEVFTPSIVFGPVIEAYDIIMEVAIGLDVKGLLEPILNALGTLVIQLDAGLEETAEALTELQAALPDSVEDPAASVGGSVNVGVSL